MWVEVLHDDLVNYSRKLKNHILDKIRQRYDDDDNDDGDDDQDLRLHESIALSFQAGPKKAAQGVADLLMIMMVLVDHQWWQWW